MDIQSLFQITTIFHAAIVGVITYFIRIWCENKWIKLLNNKQWTGIYLPSLAVLISVVLVLFSGLGPDYLVHGKLIDKLGYAVIVGFCSGYLFSALKSMLIRESGEK